MDFSEAQSLWLDGELDEYPVAHAAEPRSVVIGRIDCRYWTAAITYRGDRVRLISVRRSRAREVEEHES